MARQKDTHLLGAFVDAKRVKALKQKLIRDGISYRAWLLRRIDSYLGRKVKGKEAGK